MDEQIKQLRKSLGMSQEKFAKEIGLTKNFISLVETGQRNLSTQSIKLICQLFDVNKEWLETGKGEMFIQKTENEKIAEFLADVLKAGEKDQRYRFIAAISELDENDWNTIQKLAEKLVKK